MPTVTAVKSFIESTKIALYIHSYMPNFRQSKCIKRSDPQHLCEFSR